MQNPQESGRRNLTKPPDVLESIVEAVDFSSEAIRVTLGARVQGSNVFVLRDYLFRLIEENGARPFILEIGRLNFIDSQGLGLLLMLHKTCRKKAGKLVVLAGRNIGLRKILKQTRLDQILTIE